MEKPKVKEIYETKNYIVKRFDVDETGVKKYRKKKILTNDGREVILNFGIKNGKTILTSIWYNKNDFTKSEVLRRNEEDEKLKRKKIKSKLKRKKKSNTKRKAASMFKRKIASMLKRKRK